MNQPQAAATFKETKIKIVVEIDCTLRGDMNTLTALTEKAKPLVAKASEIGTTAAYAQIGRQKIQIV